MRKQINFCAHEKIFSSARKFIFMRTKILRRAHRDFSACASDWTALPKDDLGAPRNRTFASTDKQFTLMVSIHEEEDRILEELSNNCPTSIDKDKLVPDGLHYLGEFSYEENGCWKRVSDDEEERWKDICEQKRGLVVLTKDLNDAEVWDIRMDHGRKNNIADPTPSRKGFYENLRRWIYGLMTMSDSGEMPEYPTTEDVQGHFVEQPWVRMNLKKELGKGSVRDSVLHANIEATKESLKEQLKLYRRASIYIDCAKGEGIELLKQMYPDIISFSSGEKPRISYSEEYRFIIIDSHHPSYPRMKRRTYYDDMKKAVQAFFREHSNFLKILEKES